LAPRLLGSSAPRLLGSSAPRLFTECRRKFGFGQQKSVAIGKSNISLDECLVRDGNARRFLLPNRSKPIFSGFLKMLGM
jgi:hypothetical protein